MVSLVFHLYCRVSQWTEPLSPLWFPQETFLKVESADAGQGPQDLIPSSPQLWKSWLDVYGEAHHISRLSFCKLSKAANSRRDRKGQRGFEWADPDFGTFSSTNDFFFIFPVMARPWSDHSRGQRGPQQAWVQVDHALHRPRLFLVVSNCRSGFGAVWGVWTPPPPIAELPRPLISDLCLALQHVSWEISSMCPTGLTRTWERVKLAYRPEFSSRGKAPLFPVFKDKFSSSELPRMDFSKRRLLKCTSRTLLWKQTHLFLFLMPNFPWIKKSIVEQIFPSSLRSEVSCHMTSQVRRVPIYKHYTYYLIIYGYSIWY